MSNQAGKWAMAAALIAVTVSGCVWGGYPEAKNVRDDQLIGTWRSADCHATLTLNPDKSASASGVPTEMPPPGLPGRTKTMGGHGTWSIFEYKGTQELDFKVDHVEIPFDLYAPDGHLLLALTVGDPDNGNDCEFTKHSKSVRPSSR